MNQNASLKAVAIRTGIAILLVVALFVLRPAILGGHDAVTLQGAQTLTGQVSQAFTNSESHSLPIAGKDYELQNVTYLEDTQWVVANIHLLKSSTDDAIIVLQKKDGIYTTVLGPGTAFSNTVTESLPNNVGLYLAQLGVLYDTTGQ